MNPLPAISTMRRSRTVAAIVAATALALTGCGSSSGGTAPVSTSNAPAGATTAPSGAVMITIKDFGYSVPDSIAPGARVTVKNEDSVAHTVTADSGNAFDVTVQAGKSATFTAPDKAGTYAFHCTFHANMHGKLVVG